MAISLIEGTVREMDLDAGTGRLEGHYSGSNAISAPVGSTLFRQLIAALTTRQRIVLVLDSTATPQIQEVIATNTPTSDV